MVKLWIIYQSQIQDWFEMFLVSSDGKQASKVLPRHPTGPDPHQLPVTDCPAWPREVCRALLPATEVRSGILWYLNECMFIQQNYEFFYWSFHEMYEKLLINYVTSNFFIYNDLWMGWTLLSFQLLIHKAI